MIYLYFLKVWCQDCHNTQWKQKSKMQEKSCNGCWNITLACKSWPDHLSLESFIYEKQWWRTRLSMHLSTYCEYAHWNTAKCSTTVHIVLSNLDVILMWYCCEFLISECRWINTALWTCQQCFCHSNSKLMNKLKDSLCSCPYQLISKKDRKWFYSVWLPFSKIFFCQFKLHHPFSSRHQWSVHEQPCWLTCPTDKVF